MKERKKATKAIAISRVSSKEQEEGYSIDAQKRRLAEYCQRKGLELIKIYELIESSTIGGRKKFMEALAFAKKQKETIAVVTDKVDRLQRGFKESPLLNELIDQEKIELHFHMENCVIHKYSSSNEKLMWNMNVVMAQSFVDSLRDNVNRSIEQKLLSGEWISAAPIGYTNIKGGRRQGTIIVDQDRAPLVKRLFEEYSTGAYTLSQMVKNSKTWGLRNARGNQGYLSKAHIHSILTNPFYHGVMHYRKGNKFYPHIYEPIISKELFDTCNAVLKGWNKKPFKWGSKDFIFRGIITCAVSGRIVSTETKKRERADGTKYEMNYLGAQNPENPSRRVYVKEEILEQEVEKVFKAMYIEPELLEKVVSYIRMSADSERDYHKKRITELHKEHTRIKTKLDKLMDFFLDDKITEQEHDEKRASLTARREEIVRELDAHDKADDSFSDTMINILKLASGAHKTYILSTTEEKRKLMKLVFSTVKLNGRRLEYSLRPPFDAFVKTSKNGEWWAVEDSNFRPLRCQRSALTN